MKKENMNKLIATIGEDKFKERFGIGKEGIELLKRGNIVVSFGPEEYDSSTEDRLAREHRITATPEEVSAFAAEQGLRPVTQAELIRDSAYFVPVEKPFKVDEGCLLAAVASYNDSFKAGIGTAPKIEDGVLKGFAVWTEIIGGGYTGMNEDILQLGKHCEVTLQ